MDNVGAIAQVLWGRASTLLVSQQRILRRLAHRLRWQRVSVGLRYVESVLNPADCVSRWCGGAGGIWWWKPGPRQGSTASDRGECGGQSGTGISGCVCGTVF